MGNKTKCEIPAQVPNLTDVQSLSTNKDFTLALKKDGTVWVWGVNVTGQLGLGDTHKRRIPVPLVNLTNVQQLIAGWGHGLAIKTDDTIWSWGRNTEGQLGLGHDKVSNTNTPQRIMALNNLQCVAAGDLHSLALKKDGTLWAWGLNSHGQLGLGHNKQCNLPMQVKGLSNVKIKQIEAGRGCSLILCEDGTVWAWGNNKEGQLGLGHKNNCNRPQQVPRLVNVQCIVSGNDASIAIKNDGDIWVSGELKELKSTPTCYFTPNKALNFPATLLRERITSEANKFILELKSEDRTALLDRLNKFINQGFLFFANADEQQLILARGLKQFIEHKSDYHSIKAEIIAYAESNQKRPSPDQASFEVILKEMLDLLEKVKERYISQGCTFVMEQSLPVPKP